MTPHPPTRRRPTPTIPWPEDLDWCGLPARVDEEACVHVDTGRGVARIGVRLAEPWQRAGSVRLDLDTVEVEWTGPDARTRLRIVLGDVCHIDLLQEGEGHTHLPPPVLLVEGDEVLAPAWLLGAGALGRAGLAVEGGVLHLRQQAGDCSVHRFGDGTRALALLPPGGDAGMRRARWRCDLVAGWRQVGAQLPAWLPPADAVDAGERLVVPLPDAAVSSDAAECLVLGDATEVTLVEGEQGVTVAQASGTVRLALVGVPGDRDDLLRRARHILDSVDPRQADGVQLWLVLHARAEADAEQYLRAAAEDVAARMVRDTVPDPFAVAAVAGWAVSTGDTDAARHAVEAATRWSSLGECAVPPGARLATAWVLMCARTLHLPPPPQLPGPAAGSLGCLEHALVVMDETSVRQELDHWSDALALGLPGTSARPWVAVVVAAIARRVPQGWLRPQDAAVLPVWERRLRAGDDRQAAWLHW